VESDVVGKRWRLGRKMVCGVALQGTLRQIALGAWQLSSSYWVVSFGGTVSCVKAKPVSLFFFFFCCLRSQTLLFTSVNSYMAV